MKVSINILAAAVCMLSFSEMNAQWCHPCWGGWQDSRSKSVVTQTKPDINVVVSEQEAVNQVIVRNALNQGLSVKELADRLRMKPTEVLMVVQQSEQ
jgi:hypothetical protein